MVKVGDKVKGFKLTESDDNTLRYHPYMDLYVGVEGEVADVQEETFVIKFKNIRNLSGEYDFWHYPIADYLEITRNEKLNELGI